VSGVVFVRESGVCGCHQGGETISVCCEFQGRGGDNFPGVGGGVCGVWMLLVC